MVSSEFVCLRQMNNFIPEIFVTRIVFLGKQNFLFLITFFINNYEI